MDRPNRKWYSSNMTRIPTFSLYGETDGLEVPVHVEPLFTRSAKLNWRIKAHRHADLCQVFLIEAGAAEITVDGEQHHLEPGQFCFLPPQVVHSLDMTPETKGTVCSFLMRDLGSNGLAAKQVSQALAKPFSGDIGTELRVLTDALFLIISEHSAHYHQKVTGLGNAVLASLAEAAGDDGHAPAPGQQKRLDQLGHLVREHMEAGWTVAQYADALSVSTGHLSRLCRASTGQGAQAYIERLIMDEACRHLTFTDLPVAEIGFRTGYSDPSYFSKRFKAVLGVSPRRYRLRLTPD